MDSITRNLMILITALAWICAIGSHYTPHDENRKKPKGKRQRLVRLLCCSTKRDKQKEKE